MPKRDQSGRPEWLAMLDQQLAALQQAKRRESAEFRPDSPHSDLAQLLAGRFGGHREHLYAALSAHLFNTCATEAERSLLLGILAAWPCDGDVYFKWPEAAKFICLPSGQQSEKPEPQTDSECTVVHLRKAVEDYTAPFFIEFHRLAYLRHDSDEKDWQQEMLHIQCVIECGQQSDMARAVWLRSLGYLTHHFTPAAVLADPIKCAWNILEALQQEARRQEDERQQAHRQDKVVKLVPQSN